MSTNLVLKQEIHIEHGLNIFGYPKIHNMIRLMFDCSYPRTRSNLSKEYTLFRFYRDSKESIPHNVFEPRGHGISISMFVDDDLVGDKSTRPRYTGVFIFMNKAHIYCYRKRQETVEAIILWGKVMCHEDRCGDV